MVREESVVTGKQRAQMMRALSDWDRKWSSRWASTITPDPEYAGRTRSQYPETAVHLSADAIAEAEYWAGVDKIMAAANPLQ